MCILIFTVARIQVLVTEQERERLRRAAEREGISLSGWLRRAGLEKADASSTDQRIRTAAELERFFRSCDRRNREKGREPDWDEHLAVIDRSRGGGQSQT